MNLKPISLNFAISLLKEYIVKNGVDDFYLFSEDKNYLFLKDENNVYHKVNQIDLMNKFISCEDNYKMDYINILKSEGISNKLFISDFPYSTQCYVKEEFIDKILRDCPSDLNFEKNKFLLWDDSHSLEYIGISEKGNRFFLKNNIIEYEED